MARTLLDALRAAIAHYELLAAGDTVVAAVSGGADSVALLVALVELRERLGIGVLAAHLDHGLRGAESDADRQFVVDLTARVGITLRCEQVRLQPGNLEAEARRARYAFLERTADALGATRIATAHTLDDQAETVLLRLVRGAGRRGLAGIRPRRGRIIRPLLLCDRVQVRAFLVERGLDWRRDRSNFDLAFERARVRAGYLPALAHEFNPRLTRALARLADVLRDEDRVLDRLAATACRDGERLLLPVLRELEPALARRAVRVWWRRLGQERRLGHAHVEAVLTLARRAPGGGGSLHLPGGTVERQETALTFRAAPAAEPEATPPYLVTLGRGHAVEVPGGWRLGLTETEPGAGHEVQPSADVCILDAELVPEVLTVRNRRSGDRLRALGLGGHVSVKRLFIARRIPRVLRASYPLVLAGDEIVWVPGCARGTRALVTSRTRRRLVLRIERTPRALLVAAPER